MSQPILIAMVGLPRSGKSTLSKKLSKYLGAPIVNRDAIRLAIHGKRYEALAEPLVKAISLYMIRALFGVGHDVVICDETNFSKKAREALISPEWETRFYHVDTPIDKCIERAIITNQKDLIPVIEAMQQRWEPLTTELRYEIKEGSA